jgi:uncharacterized damage-inducible protein DinB
MDTRYGAPVAGDEKEILTGYLDHYRRMIVKLCEGLTDEQLRRPMTPTGLTVLGLVKHLAVVERWWFQEHVANDPSAHWDFDPKDPDADFRIERDETTQQILAMYEAACRGSRQIIAGSSLDAPVERPERRHDYNVRWVLVNMLVETARHCGHADIMRESLDGTTGTGYE